MFSYFLILDERGGISARGVYYFPGALGDVAGRTDLGGSCIGAFALHRIRRSRRRQELRRPCVGRRDAGEELFDRGGRENRRMKRPLSGGWVRIAVLTSLFFGLVAGAGLGIGGYTFVYAKGFSYMGNAPETCANCHVMQDHLDSWAKSSHKQVAVCNDCHTPHNFLGKYYVKAMNGFHHSLAFTTGRFPDYIRIRPSNHTVTEDACRYCHGDIVQAIDSLGHGPQALDCIRCHDTVGHLK